MSTDQLTDPVARVKPRSRVDKAHFTGPTVPQPTPRKDTRSASPPADAARKASQQRRRAPEHAAWHSAELLDAPARPDPIPALDPQPDLQEPLACVRFDAARTVGLVVVQVPDPRLLDEAARRLSQRLQTLDREGGSDTHGVLVLEAIHTLALPAERVRALNAQRISLYNQSPKPLSEAAHQLIVEHQRNLAENDQAFHRDVLGQAEAPLQLRDIHPLSL